jgi:1-acyl-sn-glycerol-3-phosphate acyltransferase
VTLGLALAACFLHYWLIRLRGPLTLERRALWLQSSCRRVMAAMGIHSRVEGAIPVRGLAVSNHLSHVDILIYGAIMPCFFISKAEVASWPYFGWAARTGGALFLDRHRRSSANAVAQAMAGRLELAVPIMLFPEGTSTEGAQVLRFHPRLFEPAIIAAAPVTAAAIRYVVEDAEERELCWYGDMPFLPHLWKVLGSRGFSAVVHFGEPQVYLNRRIAAQSTHDQVAAMRAGLPGQSGAESIDSQLRAH